MRVLTETRERAVPPVYEKHFGYSLPGWKWEDDWFLMMMIELKNAVLEVGSKSAYYGRMLVLPSCPPRSLDDE